MIWADSCIAWQSHPSRKLLWRPFSSFSHYSCLPSLSFWSLASNRRWISDRSLDWCSSTVKRKLASCKRSATPPRCHATTQTTPPKACLSVLYLEFSDKTTDGLATGDRDDHDQSLIHVIAAVICMNLDIYSLWSFSFVSRKMLEGYITPLLMSYLDKYVKNIKPSDLQLSFWGGDAVLR